MNSRILTAAAVLAIGGLGLLASTAQAAQPGDPDCLQSDRVRGWKVLDDRTMIVTDWSHRKYKISLAPGCADLKFPLGLGFKTFSTSRFACMQRSDSIIVPAGGGLPRQNCIINSVTAYTPEMEHADAVNRALDKPH